MVQEKLGVNCDCGYAGDGRSDIPMVSYNMAIISAAKVLYSLSEVIGTHLKWAIVLMVTATSWWIVTVKSAHATNLDELTSRNRKHWEQHKVHKVKSSVLAVGAVCVLP
jgi:hypothetical protein